VTTGRLRSAFDPGRLVPVLRSPRFQKAWGTSLLVGPAVVASTTLGTSIYAPLVPVFSGFIGWYATLSICYLVGRATAQLAAEPGERSRPDDRPSDGRSAG
jgi:hypothetical protein